MAAAVLTLLVLLLVISAPATLEGFASERARQTAQAAREFFAATGGDGPYQEFRHHVAGSDPVLYSDLKKLNRQRRLTPDAVEAVLP